MINKFRNFCSCQRNFIFGGTIAILTNLGLIMGLNSAINAKASIIGSILVVAIADNISDSLGIHIHQESEKLQSSKVWLSTFGNFLTRFAVSMVFVLLFVLFPLSVATASSLIFGYAVLIGISYLIATERHESKWEAIIEHVVIATVVIVVSYYLGDFILKIF